MDYSQGGFERNGSIFRHLRLKKEMLQHADAGHREIRPVLLGLSGVFRGVRCGAQLKVLHDHGYNDSFDHAVAVSTSAPAIGYSLAGQPALGLSIYWDECLSGKFIPTHYSQLPWEVLKMFWTKGKDPLMDIEYLCDVFRGKVSNKALDQEAARRCRTRFSVAVTRCNDGEGMLLDAKKTNPDMVEAIRASIAVPGVSNGKVRIDGVEYIDGVGAMPFPIELILRELDPTDILVLANRAEDESIHLVEHLLTSLALHSEVARVQEEFSTREIRFAQSLELLRNWKGRWGIVWCPPDLHAVEVNPDKLQRAAKEAESIMTTLLRHETQ